MIKWDSQRQNVHETAKTTFSSDLTFIAIAFVCTDDWCHLHNLCAFHCDKWSHGMHRMTHLFVFGLFSWWEKRQLEWELKRLCYSPMSNINVPIKSILRDKLFTNNYNSNGDTENMEKQRGKVHLSRAYQYRLHQINPASIGWGSTRICTPCQWLFFCISYFRYHGFNTLDYYSIPGTYGTTQMTQSICFSRLRTDWSKQTNNKQKKSWKLEQLSGSGKFMARTFFIDSHRKRCYFNVYSTFMWIRLGGFHRKCSAIT